MTDSRINAQEENLNDSWVELHYQNHGHGPDQSGVTSVHSVHNGNMERLLMEAQRDSSSKASSNASSRGASSRGSPRGPHSPNSELATGEVGKEIVVSDWIWDWSSRPETNPPSEWKFKHPKPRHHKLSVRNTGVMRSGIFRMENLPMLLLTHACTFFLGAATMFIYLKKYCNWSAPKIVVVPLAMD
ncbi:BCL2/adenovirus E1B 19 kDa protein-interacting protein 3-like [Lineus longissimus]|uniref:BCL2/adenovirus E1B 19 kDa protein-interacting protein 3-like n=1 Tax=Lineus longissimus TaxID=88925 RepID=UPI00315CF511